MKKLNIAVIGVGAVGIEMLRCLKQRRFPIGRLSVLARSARAITVDSDTYNVEAISVEAFKGVDIALFAGTEGEKGAAVQWAPIAVKEGAVVIDNGADFRLKKDVPLVVPEVNRASLKKHKGLIANPNCTTIQMVVALNDIHRLFGLKQIILTSFQATSGAGKKASISLWDETRQIVEKNAGADFDNLDKKISGSPAFFSNQIAFNVIPQIGSFLKNGYTNEEEKVVNETHKIFDDKAIKISATCVRVPVFTAHSETVYFTTRKPASLAKLEKALKKSEGVSYQPDNLALPLEAEGKDEVFVSRLRPDPFSKNSFWLWCVSDNLRKGAALNAVQIAEELVK